MSNPMTETWRVLNLQMGLFEPESRLRERALEAVGLAPEDLRGFRVARKSLDARRGGGSGALRFAMQVDLILAAGCDTKTFARARKAGRVRLLPPPETLDVTTPHSSLQGARVAVVRRLVQALKDDRL